METARNLEVLKEDGQLEDAEAEIIQYPSPRRVTLSEVEAESVRLTRFRKRAAEGEVGVKVWMGEHKTITAIGSAAAVLAALGALGVSAHIIHKHRQNKL